MKLLTVIAFAGLCLLAAAAGGCAHRSVSDTTSVAPEASPAAVTAPVAPAEQSDPPSTTAPPTVEAPVTASSAQPATSAATQPQSTAPVTVEPPRFSMDGMVGQVNGHAIYAATVLEPSAEQLAQFGRYDSPAEFRRKAQDLIARRLQQIVQDALILGEAERDLSDAQQQGLRDKLKKKREELLRMYGQGSLALAEETLMRDTGKTLDQTIEEHRVRVVVEHYLQQKLFPRINVTRRDIERYYRDHFAEYNPPPVRTLRLIRTVTQAEADEVCKVLASGTPFKEVAGSARNAYRPGNGGLMENATGDQVFGQPELNDAMLALQPGEHSPVIPADGSCWIIYLESIVQPPVRPLMEVQSEIELLMRMQQFRMLSDRYRARLVREGSFDTLQDMVDAVLRIAIARFGPLAP
jgi:hypothetical protein